MTTNDSLLELFKRAVGQKLAEVSGTQNVFSGNSREAGYPRISYTATVWVTDSALHGTLSCTVAGNTTEAEVDNIAYTLLRELEGFSFCSDELMYYLHSGRMDNDEEADKTVRVRFVTFDFMTMGG